AGALGMVLDRYVGVFLTGGETTPKRVLLWWSLSAAALLMWWTARRRPRVSAWLAIAGVAMAAAAWHESSWHVYGEHDISRYAHQHLAPACVEVIARSTPQRVPAQSQSPVRAIPVGERTRLAVEIKRIRDGTKWMPASGRCEILV